MYSFQGQLDSISCKTKRVKIKQKSPLSIKPVLKRLELSFQRKSIMSKNGHSHLAFLIQPWFIWNDLVYNSLLVFRSTNVTISYLQSQCHNKRNMIGLKPWPFLQIMLRQTGSELSPLPWISGRLVFPSWTACWCDYSSMCDHQGPCVPSIPSVNMDKVLYNFYLKKCSHICTRVENTSWKYQCFFYGEVINFQFLCKYMYKLMVLIILLCQILFKVLLRLKATTSRKS